MNRLHLITSNVLLHQTQAKKLQQFRHILGPTMLLHSQSIDCISNAYIVPQLQGTPQEIARQKALIAYKAVQKGILVEDTSLCFNAYKGLPGPYIKWFLEALQPAGLYRMLAGFEDKTAYALCIIAYMGPELKEPQLFVGRTEGTIVEPRGKMYFGWDPIFLPQGKDKTYGEMEKEEKSQVSHRYRAIERMKQYFTK